MSDHDELLDQLLGGKDRYEFLPAPAVGLAERLAGERREHIVVMFREFGVPLDTGPEGFGRNLPYMFREREPKRRFEPEKLNTGYDEMAQTIRLRWQMQQPEMLLAGRVLEVLSMASPGRPPENTWQPQAWMRPLVQVATDPLAQPDRFPWKVIIRTNQPALYADTLREMRAWLGIGVDFAPAVSLRLHGRCLEGTGALNGTAGGVVSAGNQPLLSTCSHVLSQGCQSAVLYTVPKGETNQPDTALLRGETPCFPIRPHAPCRAADAARLRDLARTKRPVTMDSATRGRRRGTVGCQVASAPLGDNSCLFPHVQIVAWPTLGEKFAHPFDRDFSADGDSGNWIFEEESGHWIGQVVAGMDGLPVTLAAEAQPLLEFYREAQNSPGLSPFRFT